MARSRAASTAPDSARSATAIRAPLVACDFVVQAKVEIHGVMGHFRWCLSGWDGFDGSRHQSSTAAATSLSVTKDETRPERSTARVAAIFSGPLVRAMPVAAIAAR